MRRNRAGVVTVALGLFLQTAAANSWAQGSDPLVSASVGVTSVLATVIALPVKAATCVATVALSGVGYGLTVGTGEFVRDELVGGLPYACSTRLPTLPQEMGQYATEEWAK